MKSTRQIWHSLAKCRHPWLHCGVFRLMSRDAEKWTLLFCLWWRAPPSPSSGQSCKMNASSQCNFLKPKVTWMKNGLYYNSVGSKYAHCAGFLKVPKWAQEPQWCRKMSDAHALMVALPWGAFGNTVKRSVSFPRRSSFWLLPSLLKPPYSFPLFPPSQLPAAPFPRDATFRNHQSSTFLYKCKICINSIYMLDFFLFWTKCLSYARRWLK